jgi:hypothetical protein
MNPAIKTPIHKKHDKLPLALITGASAGIGAEYARQIAQKGKHSLLLVARRKDRLERLAQNLTELYPTGEYHIQICDLRSEKQRQALIDRTNNLSSELALLVNNAGYGSLGPFIDADWRSEAEMIEVNIKAPMHLCHALVPSMISRGSGAVINLCSTASYQAMPFMATYGASKSFLLYFTVALAEEHKNSGIKFLAQCPGPTDSEFHLVVGLPYKIDKIPCMSAHEVVKQALAASDKGKNILINGRLNLLAASLNRLLPKTLSAKIVARALLPYLQR